MNEEKRKSEAESRLSHYLSQHNLRRTPERMRILGRIVALKNDFTPLSLRQSLADEGFVVSLATVYNSLKLFEAAGIIRRRLVEGKEDTYECAVGSGCTVSHINLVCSRCGKTREIKDVEIARSLKLRRYPSFVMDGFDLFVRGLCSKCRSGGRVKK